MLRVIINKLFTVVLTSLGLIGVGLAIWYFKGPSSFSLKDILFLVGLAPLAFSFILFGPRNGLSGNVGIIAQ